MLENIIFLLIGCVGGFFSGLLGIGGGVILLPLLSTLGQVSIKTAASISMVFIIFASLSGIVAHKKMGNIDLSVGIWMGASSVIGALGGTLLTGKIPEILLQLIFLGVVILAAMMLLMAKPKGENPQVKEDHSFKKPLIIVMGLIKGLLTGMLGVGGGFIVVPLMIYFLGMFTLKAIGTSLVVTLLSGIAGIIGKTLFYEPLTTATWWVILGAVPLAQLGSRVAARTAPKLLRCFLFALLAAIFVETTFELIC